MADGLTRLRINLAQREFEVEGSETFVKSYAARFEALLDRLHRPDEVADAAAPPPPAQVDRGPPEAGTFGELLQHLPRAASDVDRILVAGSFAQSRTVDRSFSTGEANALLTEQGIKVGNPSQCVKQNLVAKRVFKHLGRYRVSQSGAEHLRQLLSAALRE
ncbi:MAG: hypothetical protein ACREH6_08440 [Geminicoccaceae bacterium]